MFDVNLSFSAACSYSWISNPKSFLPYRALKALGEGIKALFGKYTVTISDQDETLMLQNPKSHFTHEVYPILERHVRLAEPTMHTASTFISGPPPEYPTETPFVKPNEDGDLPPPYSTVALPDYTEKDESPLPPYEEIYKFV